ncbi:MAG: CHASE2 domain-containing protein [Candidatus Aminicenantes bacterium]|nr:CHASE2 domain-containing protein [Candidatus Aminicenantes bacterium]
MPRPRLRRELAAVLAALSLLLVIEALGFFEGFDRSFYDLSFRLRGAIPGDRTILIAAVDDRTLARLGRWPIRRRYYAQLLDAAAGARAVGLDFLLAESSEDDGLLSAAIRRHGRVVLPIAITPRNEISLPFSPLDGLRHGHVQIEPGPDGIVRSVYHTLHTTAAILPSFASVLYEIAAARPLRRSAVPNGRKPGPGTIRQEDESAIDFYGPPGTFESISLVDILDGLYPASFFRDKILLAGLTVPGLGDQLMVPFTEDRNTMSGVEIHAQILSNLLDGRAIRPVGRILRWPAVLLGALLFYLPLRRKSEAVSVLFLAAALAGMAVASYGLFAKLETWVRPVLFGFAAVAAFGLAYFFRLDEAARRLDAKSRTLVARLSGAAAGTAESPVVKAGLAGFLSTQGLNAKIARLLAAEDRYESGLEETVRDRTRDLQEALSVINKMSNEMILRLARAVESRESGTGEHITRIGLYVERLARRLKQTPEEVERLTFASFMHDLGKIGIPDRILLKQGPLTTEEYAVMKEHTRIGERILAKSDHPKIQLSGVIALHHHEKWNGQGYPQGLRGEEIPFEARIVAICDQYDSLRSPRPYKPGFDHVTAVRIILEGDGRTRPGDFDPEVARAFSDLSPEFESIYDAHPSH